ncbi:Cmx/CmrA family chloramphenicol efflux MFS transporter, partial [Streptomyces sp. SID7499]|nr:Cmx/CmrA family chloramphenicol efflux MFS transporter [Streptomyces sp. SID7499]
GNTSGPWLGGTVIDLDFGFASTAWAGAAMTALALAAVGVALHLQRGGEGGRSRSRLIAKSARTPKDGRPAPAAPSASSAPRP